MTLGDCLEVLGGQEAGSVDLILTDPPWMGERRGVDKVKLTITAAVPQDMPYDVIEERLQEPRLVELIFRMTGIKVLTVNWEEDLEE